MCIRDRYQYARADISKDGKTLRLYYNLIQATCINAVDSRNCGNVLLELLFRASGIDNIRIRCV